VGSPVVETKGVPRRADNASQSGGLPAGRPGATALVLRVVGREARVLVRATGGQVLLNGVLQQGDVRRFDRPRLDLVVYDGSAVQVAVNGVQQHRGLPGQRKVYRIRKAAGNP
jgi:hypothetical protein